MSIRYSEIFYSFQGEAEMTGQPAVWLRFFGCNLNCHGFGQKDPTDPSTYVLPYQDFDVSKVTRNEDLPVWTTGCDSSYSWSAKYRHLAHNEELSVVVDKIVEQLKHPSNPLGLFTHPVTGQETMLSFTGGEPLLQQNALLAVFQALGDRANRPHTINIETNATRLLSDPLRRELELAGIHGVRWHFSMSPKLFTVSGEQNAISPTAIHELARYGTSSVLKFVCNGTPECWFELETQREILYKFFQRSGTTKLPPIWVMPVGATKDEQEEEWVQQLNIEAMKRGYNVANRLQCFVFSNVIGR